MRKKILTLSENVVSVFGTENVTCILLHGSILFNPHTPPNDTDLVIVLREKSGKDCLKLRQLIMQSWLARPPIHLHLIYLEEIPVNADLFSVHTCGAFFVCHLRQAEVLHGENIFDKMVGPSDYQLQLSLFQKVQQYIFQIRNLAFKIGRQSETELLWARKKTVIVLKDLFLSTGTLMQQEEQIIRKSIDSLKEFSKVEVIFLESLLKPWIRLQSETQEREFVISCLSIHERSYGIMLNRIKEKQNCRFFG